MGHMDELGNCFGPPPADEAVWNGEKAFSDFYKKSTWPIHDAKQMTDAQVLERLRLKETGFQIQLLGYFWNHQAFTELLEDAWEIIMHEKMPYAVVWDFTLRYQEGVEFYECTLDRCTRIWEKGSSVWLPKSPNLA